MKRWPLIILIALLFAGIQPSAHSVSSQKETKVGTNLGAWFYIDESLGGTPDIAANPSNGHFVVTWTGPTSTPDGSGHAVRVRGFNENGQPHRPSITVGYRQQGEPKIAFNSHENRYIVAWGEFDKVFVRIFDATGFPIGSTPIEVWEAGTMLADLLRVVYNSARNEFLVLSLDSAGGVWGTRVASTGAAIRTIYFGESACGGDITYNTRENVYFLVTTVHSVGRDIWGQTRDGTTGEVLGSTWLESDSRDQECPQTVWNATQNEFLVIWSDDFNGQDGVYGRRVDRSGVPYGGYVTLAVSAEGAGTTHVDGIAHDPTYGSYVAAWHDTWLDGNYREHTRSYVRSVRNDGTVPFPADSVEDEIDGGVAITSRRQGNYVVAETDLNGDIWGRHVRAWESLYLPVVQR